MESKDVISPIYLREDDILSSFLDINTKESAGGIDFPYNYFPDLSPSPVAYLPEVKLDRELGEFEDEGFEDCLEEEESGLHRDIDPRLAAIPLNSINTTGLDVFFPFDNTAEDVFALAPNEIFELDQGVAMESNEHQLNGASCSEIDEFALLCSQQPFTPSYSMSPAPSVYTNSVSSPNSQLDYTSRYSPSPLPLEPHPPLPLEPHPVQDYELAVPHDNYFNFLSNTLPLKTIPTDLNRTSINSHHNLSDTLNLTDVSSLDGVFNNQQQLQDTSKFSITLTPYLSDILASSNHQTSLATTSSSINSNNSSNWNWSHRSNDRHHNSPSPSPIHHQIPSPASSVTTDCTEAEYNKDLASPDVPGSMSTFSKNEIVEMPFYEFKKIVENGTIPERDKDEIKAIRKRGKNKMAAKTCRQRKLEVLGDLQRDVEKLKGVKARLALKALSLQREIEAYKNTCVHHHNNGQAKNPQQRLLATLVH
jgi:hypothetical protein